MPSYLPSLLDQKMDRSNTLIVLITGSETKKERIRECFLSFVQLDFFLPHRPRLHALWQTRLKNGLYK